jgi:HSP20 family protein
VDQLFEKNLNRLFNDDMWEFGSGNSGTSVPVNVRETDKSFEMEVVAPGLRKEDFKLNVHGDLLTISFEKKEENKQEESNWIRKDFRMESFSRSFSLDDTVDTQKISAKYDNGILLLILPKKENAQRISRDIQIG